MAPAIPFSHPYRSIAQWLIAGLLLAMAVSMFPSRKGCACERTTGHCECARGARGMSK